MKSRMLFLQVSCLTAILTITGCATTKSFVETLNPSWTAVDVRSDISYDQAWDRVVDYLVKRFDMEILSRTDGYLLTNWCHTWNGVLDESYRVRVTLKFSPDRKTLEIKTEAETGGPGKWVLGYDTRLTDLTRKHMTSLVGIESKQGG